MSTQFVYGGSTAQLSTDGSTDYLCPYGNRITANNWYQQRAPAAGTISDFRVDLDQSPGAGKDYTFTFYLNGAAQTLVVTIADGATQNIDTTHSVTVAAGDNLHIECVATGTPFAAYPRWCWTWTPTTADYTLMSGVTDSTQLPTSGTRYLPIHGCVDAAYSSETYARITPPVAGTFRDLYVRLGTAPGVGARDRKFTLMKDGAATAQVVTISGVNTTGSDTANAVTVDGATEYVSIRSSVTLSGTLPAATYVSFGLVFVPDTPGYFLVGNNGDDPLPTGTTTEYGRWATGDVSWLSATTGRMSVTSRVEVARVNCRISALPSVGSWTITPAYVGAALGPTIVFSSTSSQSQFADNRLAVPDYWLTTFRVSASATADVRTLSSCLACRVPDDDPPFMF